MMLGSQVLEIAIGLVLVFLLVSLVLTAVRETIESRFKTRAVDLERALAEMLGDRAGTGLRLALFRHPLISAMFPGAAQLTAFDATGKAAYKWRDAETTARRRMPSYIPRELFGAVLEDLVKDGTVAPGSDLDTAYRTLLRHVDGDIAAARKGIEQWYDAAMDRASGWYKRRTQVLLFWMGLAVAVALNINAVTIGQYLATNDKARAEMMTLAETVDAEAKADAAPPQAAEAPIADAAAAAGSEVPAPETASAPAAPAVKSAAEEAAAMRARIDAVGLPISWNRVQVAAIASQFAGRGPIESIFAALLLAAGYVIVGFAATLGAPFWFDILGKFMVVRSTVKPTEKSPDEKSKDGGTGGSPKNDPDPPDAAAAVIAAPASDRPPPDRLAAADADPRPLVFG